MHQKAHVVILNIYICPKREVLEFLFMFDLLPFFPCKYERNFAKKNPKIIKSKKVKCHSSAMVL
jgi:hypothetical protein